MLLLAVCYGSVEGFSSEAIARNPEIQDTLVSLSQPQTRLYLNHALLILPFSYLFTCLVEMR